MRFNRSFSLLALVALSVLGLQSCKKDDIKLPDEQAHFTNQSDGTYKVINTTVTYKIPVGFTTVSSQDRTVNINVTSPTGAVEGTHYTLDKKSVVIPAGKAIDSITVKASYPLYLTGRKDTLIFTTSPSEGKTSDYNGTFRLLVRGACFETDIPNDYLSLNGSYQAKESGYNASGSAAYTNYGPYASTIKSATLTSPTTVDIVVTNLYEVAGWQAKFTLDFSDPNNRKITTTSQKVGPGSDIGLAGYDIYVEPASTANNLSVPSTFTFCTPQVIIKFRLGARNPSTGALAGYLSAASGGGEGTFTMNLTK